MAGVMLVIYVIMLMSGTSSFYKFMLVPTGMIALGAGHVLSIARKSDDKLMFHVSNGYAWISVSLLGFTIIGSMYEAFGLANATMITLAIIAAPMIARSDNRYTRLLKKKATPALNFISVLWMHASKTKLIRLLRLIAELVTLYSQGRPFPGDGVAYCSVPIDDDGNTIGTGTQTTWCFCDDPEFHHQ